MKSKKTTLLLSLIVTLLFPAYAFADTMLHDEPPGTIITFSDKQWVVLEQKADGTTYILLNSNDGNRAFDSNRTQMFDPSDGNNIGYYLNNTFYNSLSQQGLIEEHSWDIKFQNGTGSQSNVNAKIALISYDEYSSYRGNVLPQGGNGYYWWTRTPYTGGSGYVCSIYNTGYLSFNYANATSRGIRPALYLKSGILISETKEVIGEGEEDTTPPAEPTGLSATATSQDTVDLSWNSNTEPDLANYNVYRDGVKIKGTAINSCTDNNLEPETSYTYTVTAVDSSANESDHSNPVNVTTLPEEVPEPPPAPQNVTISNITDYLATISWNTVDGAEEYKVFLNGFLYDTTQETSFELTELGPETDYLVLITALAGGLESEQSEPVSFITLPAPIAPPGKPELHATASLNGVVRLSWALDDLTVTRWEIFMNAILVKEVPGEYTETTIRDLEDGNYDFSVRAVNSAGTGDFSDTVPVNVNNIFGFNANLADIFAILTQLFKATWPLLAFIIALIALPKVIQTAKSIIVARR
ncbi:MAG TPA: fibronectin type III domain-containing protein [Desulfotomaculum sp.]|nr:MAG: hypothetical protein JL56_05845 [Desulfotomaculum sp. BICA1-6]HBX23987.1 fibronectin type III domain-containing protein [Desulfotomaculum sp.]